MAGHPDLTSGDIGPGMVTLEEKPEPEWDVLSRWKLQEIEGRWSLEDLWYNEDLYEGHKCLGRRWFGSRKLAIKQAQKDDLISMKNYGHAMTEKRIQHLETSIFRLKSEIKEIEFQAQEMRLYLTLMTKALKT